MRTTLNAEMTVIVGPEGRDVAAFTNPLDAYEYVDVLKKETRTKMGFRRPDGAALSWRGARMIEGVGFISWALNTEDAV